MACFSSQLSTLLYIAALMKPIMFFSWDGCKCITDDLDLGVSKNSGTPKSSILIGFSTINHPFLETRIWFWFLKAFLLAQKRAKDTAFGAVLAASGKVCHLMNHREVRLEIGWVYLEVVSAYGFLFELLMYLS